MLHWLAEWWDSVELWIVQLAYPLRVALVLAVLLPLFWGVAWLVDRVVDRGAAHVTRVRDAEPPVRGGKNSTSEST